MGEIAGPVLVTGAMGMLGREVCSRLGDATRGLTHQQLDITDRESIEQALHELKPTTIVNCAAWTDVDGAEAHPTEGRALNADGVKLLAEAARARGIYLLTVSTDYVFTGAGDQPWPEDAPGEAFGPLSVYGASKLEGERALRDTGGEWCIARTQWLYGAGGKNFINTIAEKMRERGADGPPLKIVNDQVGAPSWTRDVAHGICELVHRRATGVYHVVNSGFASWFDVAEFVKQQFGLQCPLEPCASMEFPRPAQRPHNSRLSQEKYAVLCGGPLRHWHEALSEYLTTQS